MCRYNRTVKASRSCRRRYPKCSRKRNRRCRYGRTCRRRQSSKGGALCPGSDDPYNIGGPNKRDNMIGRSTFLIYRDVNDPTIVVKEIELPKWLPRAQVEAEFEYARRAGDLGVGPKVFYTTFCEINGKTVGYMVMEYIDGRTFQTTDMENQEFVDQLNRLFEVMSENDMYYHDLHSQNVMVGRTSSDETERVYLIDFGDIGPMRGRRPPTVNDIELLD